MKKTVELPADVSALIDRQLRHQRRELNARLVSLKTAAFEKTRLGISECLQTRRLGAAFTSVPVTAFRELTDGVRAATTGWPHAVWQTIRQTLDDSNATSPVAALINALIDRHAWGLNGRPFTLRWVDQTVFAGVVERTLLSFGLRDEVALQAFHRQLRQQAGLTEVGLLNAAAQAREAAGIEVDAYLIRYPATQQAASSSRRRPPEDDGARDDVAKPSEWLRRNATAAAEALHNRPGGSREKHKRIRELWASGKYGSRDRCAEEECGALGMSFSAARRALRKTPEPLRA
jgi:hypothetical protein